MKLGGIGGCACREDYDGTPARLHPNRQERVMLTYVGPEATLAWTARIKRYPGQPPRLAGFVAAGENLDLAGRYVDALRLGIES